MKLLLSHQSATFVVDDGWEATRVLRSRDWGHEQGWGPGGGGLGGVSQEHGVVRWWLIDQIWGYGVPFSIRSNGGEDQQRGGAPR